MTNPVTISFVLAAPLSTGIALNQTLGSAANLTLNGPLAAGSPAIATMDVARRVGVTSAATDTSINWVLVGTDRWGNAQSETMAGVSSATSQSVNDYKTISRIAPTGATAAGVTAGTTNAGSTAWYEKEFGSMGTLGVAISMVTGNLGNFEITFDDPNAAQSVALLPFGTSVNPQSNIPPVAWPVAGLSAIAASTMGQVNTPCFAWRWTTNSGTSSTTVQVIESTWADEFK